MEAMEEIEHCKLGGDRKKMTEKNYWMHFKESLELSIHGSNGTDKDQKITVTSIERFGKTGDNRIVFKITDDDGKILIQDAVSPGETLNLDEDGSVGLKLKNVHFLKGDSIMIEFLIIREDEDHGR